MASRHRVLRSIETPDGQRCVDLFCRPDASFGFETYRRDAEDGRGWFPLGGFAGRRYASADAALAAALEQVEWLAEALGGPSGGSGGA